MKTLVHGLVAAAVLSFPVAATAGDLAKNLAKNLAKTSKASDIVVGSGLICDTRQQAERFVSVMGDNVESALVAVNHEAGQSDACVVATIGFFPGQKVAAIEKNGTVVEVVEVLVMAVGTPGGLKIVEPKMFYSVVETKDRMT